MSATNVLLTRYGGGWAEIGSVGYEAVYGRAEDAIDESPVATLEEAIRIVNQVLPTLATEKLATTAQILPAAAASTPYVGFGAYDWVTVPEKFAGTPSSMRVRRIDMRVDRNGRPLFTLGLNDLVDERNEQVERLLRKLNIGGLGGRTEAFNPGQPASPIEDAKQNIRERTWNKTGPLTLGGLEGDDETLAGTYHAAFWTNTLKVADTSDPVEVVLKVSGSTIATATILSGTNIDYTPLHRELIVQTDAVSVEITDPGTDAEGLTSTLKFL